MAVVRAVPRQVALGRHELEVVADEQQLAGRGLALDGSAQQTAEGRARRVRVVVLDLDPRAGDVVVLTAMEHHANIVPWQMLADERGIEIRWVPLSADGQLDLTDLDRLLDGAKLFAFTAMSNVLGTLPPVRRLVDSQWRSASALFSRDGWERWSRCTFSTSQLMPVRRSSSLPVP